MVGEQEKGPSGHTFTFSSLMTHLPPFLKAASSQAGATPGRGGEPTIRRDPLLATRRLGTLLEEGVVHVLKLRRWIRMVKHTPEVLQNLGLPSIHMTQITVESWWKIPGDHVGGVCSSYCNQKVMHLNVTDPPTHGSPWVDHSERNFSGILRQHHFCNQFQAAAISPNKQLFAAPPLYQRSVLLVDFRSRLCPSQVSENQQIFVKHIDLKRSEIWSSTDHPSRLQDVGAPTNTTDAAGHAWLLSHPDKDFQTGFFCGKKNATSRPQIYCGCVMENLTWSPFLEDISRKRTHSKINFKYIITCRSKTLGVLGLLCFYLFVFHGRKEAKTKKRTASPRRCTIEKKDGMKF